MEFEISKSEFLDGLAPTQGVVEKRNTLPILSNVLIEPAEGGISIMATDLDVGVRRSCEGKVKGSGSISVNARKLYEIVRAVAGSDVRVRGGENFSVEVLSGKSRFRLMGLDPKDFPSVPGLSGKVAKSAPAIQFGGSELRHMIESTIFAVSMDETRFNLSGVFVEGHEGLLRMVATDGHRLAMIDGKVEGKLPEKGVILPRKGLAEVKKILDAEDGGSQSTITFVIDGPVAKVMFGRGEFFMRLVDGEFPDYRQVIPQKGKLSILLPREEFLAALSRVSLLSTERARGVKVTIRPGTLEVQTSNPDLGEAAEEIEVGYSGPELSIGFNARYLIDALLVIQQGEKVEFTVNDDVSPGVLRAEGDERFSYVVMPMRL